MRAYLDHASTTPLRPEAFDAMVPFLRDQPADPSRVYHDALGPRHAIEVAREAVAALVDAPARSITFTSGGTESCNAAVYSTLAARPGHVVVSAVEHSAVLAAVERSGAEHTVVPVDSFGAVDPDAFIAALRPDTTLACLQLANHEVGTLQPVAAVSEATRDRTVLLFTDACTAAGHVPISLADLGCDLLAITAHKLGGPKGAGALVARSGVRLPPFLVGGSQERARRGGIENVAAIAGFGAAARALTEDGVAPEADAQRVLTDALVAAALAVPDVTRFGHPTNAVPHLACFSVGGVEAEPVLLALDQRGVAVHSGSSCASEVLEPSPVLAAMGVDADHSLRVSVGWSSTMADVERFVAAFGPAVADLRALRT